MQLKDGHKSTHLVMVSRTARKAKALRGIPRSRNKENKLSSLFSLIPAHESNPQHLPLPSEKGKKCGMSKFDTQNQKRATSRKMHKYRALYAEQNSSCFIFHHSFPERSLLLCTQRHHYCHVSTTTTQSLCGQCRYL